MCLVRERNLGAERARAGKMLDAYAFHIAGDGESRTYLYGGGGAAAAAEALHGCWEMRMSGHCTERKKERET